MARHGEGGRGQREMEQEGDHGDGRERGPVRVAASGGGKGERSLLSIPGEVGWCGGSWEDLGRNKGAVKRKDGGPNTRWKKVGLGGGGEESDHWARVVSE